MLVDIITFGFSHPFLSGLVIGGCGLGGGMGLAGWCIGHDHAMRTVGGWVRPKVEEAHGDMPTLPPQRRYIPTVRS